MKKTEKSIDKYKSYIKSLGLDSFRTSIQWSRLLDRNGKLNQEGADFYHRVCACAKENQIELFMNLYHFDMPTYLFERGGWEGREVQYHLSLAHSLAVREFRLAKEEGYLLPDARIGLINCFAPPYTKEDPSPEDLEALRMEDGLKNRWWLDLVTKGTLPEDVLDTLKACGLAPKIRPGDKEILQCGIVDWLGFNYYHPSRIQAPKEKTDEKGYPKFSDPYVWPEAKMNIYRGWEIYPKGIYDFGMKMKEEYPELKFFSIFYRPGKGRPSYKRERNDT